MKKIILISCVSKKRQYRARAGDLYISHWFGLALEYARRLKPDAIFILSAKYGLLDLETEIEPYNTTLNSMTSAQRQEWAKRVIAQLKQRANIENDHFVILAGLKYRQYLLPYIVHYEIPLEGLRIGEQNQYLQKLLND